MGFHGFYQKSGEQAISFASLAFAACPTSRPFGVLGVAPQERLYLRNAARFLQISGQRVAAAGTRLENGGG